MIYRMLAFIKQLKFKFWLSLIAEVILALILYLAFSYWQEKDMLESSSAAPTLQAQTLTGESYQFDAASKTSERTLIYFFAGEATARVNGTCHGAYWSGIRAAHEVAQVLL